MQKLKINLQQLLKSLIVFSLGLFLSSCTSTNNNTNNTTNNTTITSNDSPLFSDNITINTSVPMLVFLVSFNRKKINSNNTIWANKFFGTNDKQLNHYYNKISGGKFQVTPAQESSNIANDGIVNILYGTDKQYNYSTEEVGNMIANILSSSVIDSLVNFKAFDKNQNNTISRNELQLFFIFAGDEKATTNNTGIWAHSTSFNKGITVDGVVLSQHNYGGDYVAIGEKHIIKTTTYTNNIATVKKTIYDATIGIIAHELGHAIFNLPDLYDVNGQHSGIGRFGLMGSGSWARTSGEKSGESPSHMIGYNKIKANFINPTILQNSTTTAKVVAANNSNQNIYKIMISDPKEYFLIENRERAGYDAGMLESGNIDFGGLLITHINENRTGNGLVKQKLVDIEEANNPVLDASSNVIGNKNNLFFSNNQANFTPSSTPNSNADNGSTTGISIENISTPSATMTFNLTL